VTAQDEADETSTVGRWDRSTVPLLGSTFCSSAGALALVTALGKQVFDMTGREIDLGLLGLAEFAPAALLVLLTGALADRHDRRRLGAIGALVEAVGALLLIVYLNSNPTAVGPIFGVAVLYGAGRAFAAPAVRALPADVVSPARLPWLVARWSAVFQLAFIVGPVLGGTLYVVGPLAPYLAAMALFLSSSVLILLVRVPKRVQHELKVAERAEEPESPTARERLHQALEGLRFVRRQPILLGAISLDLFAVLFGGAVALLPAIAEDRLGVGAVGFGWLRAAVGIGAGAVTLVLARHPITRRVGRTLLVAVAVFGAGTIVLGVTHSYVIAFSALLVLSGADALSVFIRSTLVPLVTPRATRGRVLAVETVFIGASNELGAFESGVAGQLLGPAAAVALGGVATIAIAGVWWTLFPALRRVDRFPQAPEEVEVVIDEDRAGGTAPLAGGATPT
jgi:MFS family permease